MTKKIIVVGAGGKMGSQVCQKLKNNYEVICVKKGDLWGDLKADLIIDFGSAESSVISAENAIKNNISLIVGSTGQSEAELQKIKQASQYVPILICSNFSIGIALIKECIDKILNTDVSDICILEKHHRLKKDKPSGTAFMLKNFINSKIKLPIQMLSERGGDEIGTHCVDFYFGDELISIKHQAFSRQAFVDGVLLAVEYIFKQTDIREYAFSEAINYKFGQIIN